MFNWKKDIGEQPIDTMLLFEGRQLLYLPEHENDKELALVFRARPYISWFVKNKAPELSKWVDDLITKYKDVLIPDDMEAVERELICSMEDWVVYVTTPDDYHNQPFVN